MTECLTGQSAHMRRFQKSWSYLILLCFERSALVSLAPGFQKQSNLCVLGVFIVPLSYLLRL